MLMQVARFERLSLCGIPYFSPLSCALLWKNGDFFRMFLETIDSMSTNLEREQKLRAPAGFSLARLPRELKSFTAAAPAFERLHTVYFDTADFRLMRWDCSLRYRRGDGWTLKIPVPGARKTLVREEHAFPGDEHQPPQAALDLAAAYLRSAPVQRVAELRTVRVKREFQNDRGDDIAEVVDDDVRVVDGSRVVRRFHQIEIELEDGIESIAADAIADALRDFGAGAPNAPPKNVAAVTEADIVPEVTVPAVSPESPVRNAAVAALAESVIQLIRTDAKLRSGNDADAVHQARVAVRRLRSDLQTFRPILDRNWAESLRERLSWLQDQFSPVRDNDVLAAAIEATAQTLPANDARHAEDIVAGIREDVERGHERLRAALRDPKYLALLDDLVAAATAPKEQPAAGNAAAAIAPKLMRRAYKKLRDAVRCAGTPPADRELHNIRIKAKHLRYAAESLEKAVRPVKELARRAERLQTLLGSQHDDVVMIKRLRGVTGDDARVFAAGELAMLAMQNANDARRAWRREWKACRRAFALLRK